MDRDYRIKQVLATELTTLYFLWHLSRGVKINSIFVHIYTGKMHQNLGFKMGLELGHSNKEMCLWVLKPHCLIWQELLIAFRSPTQGMLGERKSGRKNRGNELYIHANKNHKPVFFFLLFIAPCVDLQGSIYLSHACHQRWDGRVYETSERSSTYIHSSMWNSQKLGVVFIQVTWS